MRLTALSSRDGSSIGHLAIECDGELVADHWGDLDEGEMWLPRTENGRRSLTR